MVKVSNYVIESAKNSVDLQVSVNDIVQALEKVSFQEHIGVSFCVGCASWNALLEALIANLRLISDVFA
jgi:hypothetical protein